MLVGKLAVRSRSSRYSVAVVVVVDDDDVVAVVADGVAEVAEVVAVLEFEADAGGVGPGNTTMLDE